jgi:iron complex transport system substrate-binding protein
MMGLSARCGLVSVARALASAALALGIGAAAHAADAPRRILSFNLCADQLVVGLADPDQIAGLSPYATDPASSVVAEKAKPFRRVGFQAESIVPLAPDLILVGTWDRPLTQRMLRELGFRVVPVALVNSIDGALAQIHEVAALVGHPERGEAMIADIKAARARLAAARPPVSASALLVGNAGYTVGPDSLAAALLAEAGLKPPSGAPTGYGGYIPLEKLIMLQPDYLVLSSLIERPDNQGALYLTHPALRALYPAARRIILPARYTLCGGPSLIAALNYLTGVVTGLKRK